MEDSIKQKITLEFINELQSIVDSLTGEEEDYEETKSLFEYASQNIGGIMEIPKGENSVIIHKS